MEGVRGVREDEQTMEETGGVGGEWEEKRGQRQKANRTPGPRGLEDQMCSFGGLRL